MSCNFAGFQVQVTDTKPKRPSWSGLPIGGDNAATAVGALGYTVIIGDKEGNLHRWELATGRVHTTSTGQVWTSHTASAPHQSYAWLLCHMISHGLT